MIKPIQQLLSLFFQLDYSLRPIEKIPHSFPVEKYQNWCRTSIADVGSMIHHLEVLSVEGVPKEVHKVLRRSERSDHQVIQAEQELFQSFCREVYSLQILNNLSTHQRVRFPQLIGFYKIDDVDKDNRAFAIALNFIAGSPLNDCIYCLFDDRDSDQDCWSEGGFLETLKDYREIVRSVCIMHKNGIAHRDIKLDNILKTSDGKIILHDFGASMGVQGFASWTIGTDPKCASPLYLESSPSNGFADDIWALGLLLYGMTTTFAFVDLQASTEMTWPQEMVIYRQSWRNSLKKLENRIDRIASEGSSFIDRDVRVIPIEFRLVVLKLVRKMLQESEDKRIALVDVDKILTGIINRDKYYLQEEAFF